MSKVENEQSKCYTNRELSWLKFNERVLEESADSSVPLCERLSFLSIFQSNLDEFFMVRVGSLHDQMLVAPNARENKTNMTAKEQIDKILDAVNLILKDKDKIYTDVMNELKNSTGIELVNFQELSKKDAEYMEHYFDTEISPLISPIVVGKQQPFPFLKSKEIYAVALLKTKRSNEKIAIVPCHSDICKRLISVPSNENKYLLVEEIILHFLPKIFENYKIKSKSLIRMIRNADISEQEAYYDEEIDFRDVMEQLLKKRKKLCPIKLEFSRTVDQMIIQEMCKNLGLKKEQLFYSVAPLDLSFFIQFQDKLKDNTELFYEKRIPQYSAEVDENKSMIAQIREKDVLLSYPYESMKPFLRLLQEASEDDKVVSIKMTLYRVARYSKIVETLIEAAENGKDVTVLVELRARFDEANNIGWSRRLEEAGCHIIYGLDNLKVHSKLCLITRKEKDKIEYISHVGTGNFNEKTAKFYTDFAYLTSNKDICSEVSKVFQSLSLGEVVLETNHLLVSPKCMQNKIIDKIEKEIQKVKNGKEGYIGIKINSFTDKTIIDKCIEASQQGVKIEMIVRGICCLVSGIEGYTDNIIIKSIVGRYLEHSRIYIFGTKEDCEVYISSADFMTRNTLKRVEVAAPIYDEKIKERILAMFSFMFRDNVKARIQHNDGTYTKQTIEGACINSQEYFYDDAYRKSSLKNQEEDICMQ